MLWLIWIAIILLTPVFAGIGVWCQVGVGPREAAASASGESNRDS